MVLRGKAGATGFRSFQVSKAGWRYGFVALLKDGTRLYSRMGAARYANGINPVDSLDFAVPANVSRLWLVVSGAPQEYWHHAWDDNDQNDEQWPYQVRFGNTNLLGQANPPLTGVEVSGRSERAWFTVRKGVLELSEASVGAEIVDVRGGLLRKIPAGSSERSISLGHLPKGVFVVRARDPHSGRVRSGSFAHLD